MVRGKANPFAVGSTAEGPQCITMSSVGRLAEHKNPLWQKLDAFDIAASLHADK